MQKNNDSIACIALASACVIHFRIQQDMDLQIKSVHDRWMGTKKKWAAEVWTILGQRKQEKSLFTRKYTLPVPEPKPEAAVQEEKKQQNGSSFPRESERTWSSARNISSISTSNPCRNEPHAGGNKNFGGNRRRSIPSHSGKQYATLDRDDRVHWHVGTSRLVGHHRRQ